jgi:trimethylamine--corrinoid protein Co-methyltransferase
MTLLPTFLAGTNFVMHAAGWLEGGLVSCYEKFIIDIELLRMLRVQFTPLEISEESLAFGARRGRARRSLPWRGAHDGAVPGLFLPAAAVVHRELRALDAPRGKDTTERAGEIWRAKLEAYEPPPLDDAIRAKLDEYVSRRRRELGD